MRSDSTERFWRTAQTVWFAMIVAQLMMVFVLIFLGQNGSLSGRSVPTLFLPAFLLVAVSIGAISMVLPRFLVRSSAARLGLPPRPEPEQLRKLQPAAMSAMVVGLALSESISIFGFLLGFLGAPAAQFAPFFGAGLLLSLVRYPTDSWLRSLLPGADTL